MANTATKQKPVVKEAAIKSEPPIGTGRFDVAAAQKAAVADAATRSKPAATKPIKASVAPATPDKPKLATIPLPNSPEPAPARAAGGIVRAGAVLRDNVERANALSSANPVMATTVHMPLYLRMVEWNGGYLIGLVDDRKSTYAECEFFDNRETADAAWKEWLVACAA